MARPRQRSRKTRRSIENNGEEERVERRSQRRRPREGRPPDFYLKAKLVDWDRAGWKKVGAAWWTDAGDGLSIQLDPFVVLNSKDFSSDTPLEDRYKLILYPVDEE